MKLVSASLVHPDSQNPLKLDWKNQVIEMGDEGNYKAGFQHGVPYILPVGHSAPGTSKLHADQGTEFKYADHYENDAEEFDYFKSISSRVDQEEKNRLNQMILNRIPAGVSSVLDVGCGNGWLSQAMVSDKVTVISMDISSRNPVEAVKRNTHPHHEALIADVYHLPLQENFVDCIVASEIMEHVPDPAMFIEKLLFVLRPGGKLIITTPYNEQIQYHLCVHCNRPTPAHAHLHSFNEKNISKLIPKGTGSWKWRAFSHKYMSKSRLYVMMKGLPFRGWNTVDRTINKLWRRPMRLMLEVEK